MSEWGFDARKLDAWLKATVAGVEGEMVLQPISGGQSNPTFFVTYPTRRMVLRKRPAGPVLPSAHAVDREHRIQAALTETEVPVPRMLAFHPEPDVIGTAFYVMERLEGRVFGDCSFPGVSPEHRRAMVYEMADTLAKLHRVDWRAAGLEGFGREGGFFERQVARWTKQWELSKTREIPDIDRVATWLSQNLPADEVTTIAHGDFRIGNLMYHPTEPRVVGVLDWELSTLGHPLADLAYSALAWRLAPDEYMGMQGLDLWALGIPDESEYVARYTSQVPQFGPMTPFHIALSLFRLAVIFEGIAARAKAGVAAGNNASTVGELSIVFARRAFESI